MTVARPSWQLQILLLMTESVYLQPVEFDLTQHACVPILSSGLNKSTPDMAWAPISVLCQVPTKSYRWQLHTALQTYFCQSISCQSKVVLVHVVLVFCGLRYPLLIGAGNLHRTENKVDSQKKKTLLPTVSPTKNPMNLYIGFCGLMTALDSCCTCT